MIVYQLACPNGHFFEGWFASAEACERQAAGGLLECPSCSSVKIRKLPSAPHVHTSGETASASADAQAERRQAIAALRKYILANTENVGSKFAEIARRIHYKEEEERGIRGQVTREEAAELEEEGVPAYGVPADVLPSEEVH